MAAVGCFHVRRRLFLTLLDFDGCACCNRFILEHVAKARASSVCAVEVLAVPASELIYDWNKVPPEHAAPARPISLDDETSPDGFQSPSVCEPAVGPMIELRPLMKDLCMD